jgi:hypothetical protein
MYWDTGIMLGTGIMRTVNYGASVASTVLPPSCSAAPCTIPPGVYSILVFTNCLYTSGACPLLAMNISAGTFALYSESLTGWSSGFPGSLTGAPFSGPPVSYLTQEMVAFTLN